MSSYVENINILVKKLLKTIDKNDINKIKLNSYFTNHPLMNSDEGSKKIIRCVIKCLYDMKKEYYVKNYLFRVEKDLLVVVKKSQKHSQKGNDLEIIMKKYVKDVIDNGEEWNIIEDNFNLNFFIKVIATEYNEYFSEHIFKIEDNKLRIIPKIRLNILVKEFIKNIENNLIELLDDETLYSEFEFIEFNVSRELMSNQFMTVLLSSISEDIKNKFRFSLNECNLRVEFNHCQKLFCNGVNCKRCHQCHQYGEFSNFLNFLSSLMVCNKGIYNDEKTVVYYIDIDEDLLEFESDEEKKYYYLQRKLKDKGLDYDYEYFENKNEEIKIINIQNDYYSNYYEKYSLENKVYNYLFKLDRIEIENIIYNYVRNPNLILYVDDENRNLHIKFNYWNKFLKDLERLTMTEQFPCLISNSKSNSSLKSLTSINSTSSVWSRKDDWKKVGYCKWILENNEILEDEDKEEIIEKEISKSKLEIKSFPKLQEYRPDTPPLSPYDLEIIRKCPTPKAIDFYEHFKKKDYDDYEEYYDFNDSNYENSYDESHELDDSIEFEYSDEEELELNKKKVIQQESIQDFFNKKKLFKAIKN